MQSSLYRFTLRLTLRLPKSHLHKPDENQNFLVMTIPTMFIWADSWWRKNARW